MVAIKKSDDALWCTIPISLNKHCCSKTQQRETGLYHRGVLVGVITGVSHKVN